MENNSATCRTHWGWFDSDGIAGQPVTVIVHDQPTAFALAHRRWGIVISIALMELLTADELTAVVTHEAAHLRQRHH